jgi:hypothetical protein
MVNGGDAFSLQRMLDTAPSQRTAAPRSEDRVVRVGAALLTHVSQRACRAAVPIGHRPLARALAHDMAMCT